MQLSVGWWLGSLTWKRRREFMGYLDSVTQPQCHIFGHEIRRQATRHPQTVTFLGKFHATR